MRVPSMASLGVCAGALALGGCNTIFGVDELTEGNEFPTTVATAASSAGAGGSATSTSHSSSVASGSVGAGGSGAGPSAGGDGGSPNLTGCSDASVEIYPGEQNIAGCSGAWSVEGVKTQASLQPMCNRQAGNTGVNSSGAGCTIEDLCALGFHVCAGAQEVEMIATNCPTGYPEDGLWLTRQGQSSAGACNQNGVNNVTGCGQGVGSPAGNSCSPLDRELTFEACNGTTAWECGQDGLAEAIHVIKTSPAEGGVLCCRD